MEMSSGQMARLGELLDQALAMPATERQAWLDALPETDRPLLQRLRDALLLEEPGSVAGGLPEHPPAIGGTDAEQAGRHAGERLGAYELLRPLGAGGMAEVWLARRADGAFEREVALKIPRLHDMPEDMARRFARECRILAALEYPGIARLYDAGVDAGGVPYIAMEYVQGEPLTSWCDARDLDTPERLRVFLQVLDAVNFAHQRQVLHRDLKPSNILVTRQGEVRLLDFGVARLLQAEPDAPLPPFARSTALTPGYASPELLRGEPVDARSDVYSLGVVLHEMLTGFRPVAISSGAGSRVPERALRGKLREVVMKALAPLPADRYADVAGFSAALRPLALAGSGSALARMGNRARIGLVAGLAALAATAAALSWQSGPVAVATPVRPLPFAVLPFENLDGSDQDYRANGFTEAVLDHFSRVPGLRMKGEESTLSFRGRDLDLAMVAEKLGVRYLLRGSVQLVDDDLNVNLQLIDSRVPEPPQETWSHRYPAQRGMRDLLDTIVMDITQALDVAVDPAMLAHEQEGGTEDLEAAAEFSKWRQIVLQDQQATEDVIVALQKALARDIRFAQAWDGLAKASEQLSMRSERTARNLKARAALATGADGERLLKEADRASRDASLHQSRADMAAAMVQQLAPDSWLVWRNRAYAALLAERWEEAEANALKVYASPPLTLEKIKPLADVLFAMGRLRETIELEARELDFEPLSMWISRNQQYNLYAARRYEEAEEEFRLSEDMHGSHADPRSLAFLRLLARGDADAQALRELFPREALQDGVPQVEHNRAFFAALGDRPALRALMRKAHADGQDVSPLMADALGDTDLAVSSLRKNFNDARHKILSPAYWHPWLLPNSGARAHPEFKQLMIDNGLAAYWRSSNNWADDCRPTGDGVADFQCR